MKVGNRKILLVLLIGLVGCGLKERDMQPAAYAHYFEQGDIVRKINAGSVSYEVGIEPPELIALRETRTLGQQAYKSRLKDIKDNIYFHIQVSAPQEQADKYLAFTYYEREAKQHLHLDVDGKSMVEAAYVLYEDNYGLSPHNNINICFNCPLSDVKQNVTLIYDDALFNKQGLRASYTRKEIDQFPKLNQ
jgi:hypothetical protein